MKVEGDPREWYFVLIDEWLVPTESGRMVLEDTYDDLESARNAALERLRRCKADFEGATRLKASEPVEYGSLTCIMDTAEGQDEEWYECVKIVPIPYGIWPVTGYRPEAPKGLV